MSTSVASCRTVRARVSMSCAFSRAACCCRRDARNCCSAACRSAGVLAGLSIVVLSVAVVSCCGSSCRRRRPVPGDLLTSRRLVMTSSTNGWITCHSCSVASSWSRTCCIIRSRKRALSNRPRAARPAVSRSLFCDHPMHAVTNSRVVKSLVTGERLMVSVSFNMQWIRRLPLAPALRRQPVIFQCRPVVPRGRTPRSGVSRAGHVPSSTPDRATRSPGGIVTGAAPSCFGICAHPAHAQSTVCADFAQRHACQLSMQKMRVVPVASCALVFACLWYPRNAGRRWYAHGKVLGCRTLSVLPGSFHCRS